VNLALSPLNVPNVLVVDDDPAVCSSLKFSLELEGFAVRTFRNGPELLSAYDLPPCGCLVIDYRMPSINGIDLLRRLRQQGNAMPAILITTAPDPTVRHQAGAEGMALVEKPLLGDALVDTIRSKVAPPRPDA
jgi:two-component system, LuxR family, response regulator FixJ